MSENIYETNQLDITSFWGGEKKGKCIQFTPPYKKEYSTHTKEEIKKIVKVLKKWLDEY